MSNNNRRSFPSLPSSRESLSQWTGWHPAWCSLLQKCPHRLLPCFTSCWGEWPPKLSRVSGAKTAIWKQCVIQWVIWCESSICTFANTDKGYKQARREPRVYKQLHLHTHGTDNLDWGPLALKVAHAVTRIQCYCPAFCSRQEHLGCKKSSYFCRITLKPRRLFNHFFMKLCWFYLLKIPEASIRERPFLFHRSITKVWVHFILDLPL